MPEASRVFHGGRLQSARMRRGLTKSELSSLAGLSAKSISDFENDRATPSTDSVSALAAALRLKPEYLGRAPLAIPGVEQVSFRSRARMPAKSRDAALSMVASAIELRAWIDHNYSTPDVDVPTVGAHQDRAGVSAVADLVRARWGLGDAPLGSLVHLLELHGVAVFSVPMPSSAVDAFSYWAGTRPFVFLTTTKSAERRRFDAAHELGHLVLHQHESRELVSDVEQAANAFASAFLMPEADLRAVVPRTLPVEEILRLKTRWGVSAMALAYRLHDLQLLTDWEYHRVCVDLARAGFRSGEPGGMKSEQSRLLQYVFDDLRKSPRGVPRLLDELSITRDDLNELVFGLVPVALDGESRTTGRVEGHLRVLP